VAVQEAVSRSTALASENVSLEASLLASKSSALKAEKAASEATTKAAKLEKALEKAKAEAVRVGEEATKLAQEKRALFVRLKQTESRLNKVLDDTGVSSRARDALMAGLAPVATTSVDSEAQCDLLQHAEVQALEQALTEARAAAESATGDAQAAREALAAAEAATQELQAQHAALQEQAHAAQQQLVLAAQQPGSAAGPAAAVPAGMELVSDLMAGVRLSASGGDPPSASITERALASLPSLAARSKASDSASSGPLSPTVRVVADLARWLPHGPVTSNSAVAAMAEEEVRLVGSIHALLAEYEGAHAAALSDLRASMANNNALRASNSDLRHKLEMTTQRLELALSQGAAAGAFYSPTISTSSIGAPYSAHSAAMRGGGGGAGAGGQGQQGGAERRDSLQGAGQQLFADPASPLPGSYLPPAARLQGQLSASSGGSELLGAAQDPVVAEATRAAMLASSLQAQTPGRRGGLLGFLFARPARPKKRIRNALI